MNYQIGKYLINKKNGHVGRIVKIIENEDRKVVRLLTDLCNESIDSIIEIEYEDICCNWEEYTWGFTPLKGEIKKMKLLDQELLKESTIHIEGQIGTLFQSFDVILPKFNKYSSNENLENENSKQNSKRLMKILIK